MGTHRVDLRVEGDHLEYDSENHFPVEFHPEDTLVMSFAGVPEHYIPALSALRDNAPFGPFLTVQVESSSLCCQGCGHTGDATFEVWPLLVSPKDDDPPIKPARAFEVKLVQGVVRHVRQIYLTIVSDDSVVVAPGDSEQIWSESVVEWLFHFANPDHPPRVPIVVFEKYEGQGNPEPSGLGPFSALRVNSFSSFEGTRFRIIGSGNNRIGGTYRYSVGVIDPTQPGDVVFKRLEVKNLLGKLVDPAIDNSGSPP
jgi:hypothetical protein